MNNKLLSLLSVVGGLAFFILAVVYIIEPAKSLPSFMPGYDPTLTRHHFTHAIGVFCLGLGSFALAWFTSAKKKSSNKEE